MDVLVGEPLALDIWTTHHRTLEERLVYQLTKTSLSVGTPHIACPHIHTSEYNFALYTIIITQGEKTTTCTVVAERLISATYKEHNALWLVIEGIKDHNIYTNHADRSPSPLPSPSFPPSPSCLRTSAFRRFSRLRYAKFTAPNTPSPG